MGKGQGKEENYMTMFLAELIGTALLMFLGCMGCVTQFDNPTVFHHMASINFGLVITLIIQIFGHISGAHLNPAVTLATYMCGHLQPVMCVVYVIAQFIGATVGFGLLRILIPEDYAPDGFCITTIHPKITTIQALAIEMLITTVLIFVCCAVWDQRNADKQDSIALKFGFIIAAISMAAGPLTGASMNTARSFAPLLFSNNWQNQWIYLVGPNLAVPLGCGLYKYAFSISDQPVYTKQDNVELQVRD